MRDYFRNLDCECFPCHEGVGRDNFNCMFCYCPLYAWGKNCGGTFTFTDKGVKDCSCCVFPHVQENYPDMLERIKKMHNMDSD